MPLAVFLAGLSLVLILTGWALELFMFTRNRLFLPIDVHVILEHGAVALGIGLALWVLLHASGNRLVEQNRWANRLAVSALVAAFFYALEWYWTLMSWG